MKRLYLVDGMALLFRSYFAMLNAGLRAADGEPTWATFGFLSTLERILEEKKPDMIGVAWDTAEPTFRHERYPEYKGNRPDIPEDMPAQIERVKDLLRHYRIPCVELPGFEADDVIGTLADRAEKEGIQAYCITPDKDFFQLVTGNVFVIRPARPGEPQDVLDPEAVRERFGVLPDQVVDVLALMGDSSDNVPGVRGIGPKTAVPLIEEFGSLENLYEKIDEVEKKGTKTKLEKGRDEAFLSQELVTIRRDAPVDVTFDDLRYEEPDVPSLLAAFKALGFSSLIRRYTDDVDSIPSLGPTGTEDSAPAESSIDSTEVDYKTITSLDELRKDIERLRTATTVAFDTETDSTDEHRAQLIGISFSSAAGSAVYVPIAAVAHRTDDKNGPLFETEEPVDTQGLPIDNVIEIVRPLLEDTNVGKVGQNAKFDALVLARHGIDVEPIAFDTMLAAYVLDSTQKLGMDALSRAYLGYDPIPITDLIGERGRNQKTLLDVPLEEVSKYACEDADITWRLYEELSTRLESEELIDVATSMEFPLVNVLRRMESTGIRIDPEALGEISDELAESIERLEREIHELAGRAFTINSPKQLGEVLFDELGLPPKKKTKTGYSTDAFVLEELSTLHPLPEKILEYRQASKLKSTYVDALPALMLERTGRVHTSYNQAVTSTGRLSSNNPNLQNIPIRSEIGRSIRKAFVAGIDDGLLVAADYSQIELRIMAHICGDPAMIEAFSTGFDIHTATAMRVFSVEESEVTGNMRRRAKEVNFGIMYGIGPFGLARRLKIDQSEGKELIETYFEQYPGVRSYINNVMQSLRETGTVATLAGRRRHYGNPDSLRNPQKGMVERAAINMPIQGTAADIIKLAMIDIDREIGKEFPGAAMLLQVHDELVFEVDRARSEEFGTWVTERMQSAFSLGEVALIVETGIGENWFEAH